MAEKKKFVLVSVESPYNASNPFKLVRNIQYAILCNTVEASRGHATWAPHVCNTQVVASGVNAYFGDTLADWLASLPLVGSTVAAKYAIGRERTLQITNEARRLKCDAVVCYVDFGISSGMLRAIDVAKANNICVIKRTLPKDAMSQVFGQSVKATLVPVVMTLAWLVPCIYGCVKFVNQ